MPEIDGHREDVLTEAVSRRINAERIVLLGWSRAILLQLAHPLVAAGVSAHSSFRGGPIATASRLHHTVRAMLALTFGGDAMREAALDGIRAIHRRVHGRLPAAAGRFPEGTPYSAEDPALLLWVHVTLIESVVLVYELTVAPLTSDERNRYCAEASSVAIALGARDAEVPRTWNALRACLDATYASGSIAVSGQARELAAAVLAPPMARVIWPATWANRLVTIGLLPDEVRRQYGFAWSPSRERARVRLLRVLAGMRRLSPALLTQWPESRAPRDRRTPLPSAR